MISIVFIVLMEGVLNGIEGLNVEARAILNSFFAAIFMGSIASFLLTTMGHVVVSAMDVIYFCFAVEDDLGQKQPRHEELYEAIKMTIVPGTVSNQGVVMGTAPGQEQKMMQVQCTEGASPGFTLQVNGPNGPLQVQVPPGVMPGQIFMVAV